MLFRGKVPVQIKGVPTSVLWSEMACQFHEGHPRTSPQPTDLLNNLMHMFPQYKTETKVRYKQHQNMKSTQQRLTNLQVISVFFSIPIAVTQCEVFWLSQPISLERICRAGHFGGGTRMIQLLANHFMLYQFADDLVVRFQLRSRHATKEVRQPLLGVNTHC